MSDIKSRVFDRNLTPFERLTALIAVLRSPGGCSWDRKQTHRSLLPYLIEEAYEVIEAIETEDYDALRGELGDLLCQVVYHGQLAAEAGRFSIDDSINHIVDKLVRRHPHVFGEQKELSPKEVRDQWEKLKIEAGENRFVLSGIPTSMPALTMAYRIGEKAGGVGFDWKHAADVLDKLDEEIQEIKNALQADKKQKLAEEIGDLLFAVASLARKLEIDPEQALRDSLRKFRRRFEKLQEEVTRSGKKFEDFSLEQLEEIWQRVK
jgi:MazG family protein